MGEGRDCAAQAMKTLLTLLEVAGMSRHHIKNTLH